MLYLNINNYLDNLTKSFPCDFDQNLENIISFINYTNCSSDRMIWVLGNGGSLAIAQHLAQDLIKLCNVRAQTLNCPSLLTAYSNDDGFINSYFKPLSVLSRKNDLFLIFSCSGKSRNYLNFDKFKENKNTIISIVGTEGNFLKEISDFNIHIKSNDYQICETIFQIIADLIVKNLRSLANESICR